MNFCQPVLPEKTFLENIREKGELIYPFSSEL